MQKLITGVQFVVRAYRCSMCGSIYVYDENLRIAGKEHVVRCPRPACSEGFTGSEIMPPVGAFAICEAPIN